MGGMFTMGEESIRVLIVDDEFIMRQGLRYMIHWEEEGFTIVGEAAMVKMPWIRSKSFSHRLFSATL